MATSTPDDSVTVQAFDTAKGKQLLVINKRHQPKELELPADAAGATLTFVAPSGKDEPPVERPLQGTQLHLEPFEVAIIHWK